MIISRYMQALCCMPESNLLLLLPGHFSRVRLCATPQTAAHQAPPSLGFSRQEHWSGLPSPSPESNITHVSYEEKWKCESLTRVRLFVTPWTVAHQAPLSTGFSRWEYWNGLPFPSLWEQLIRTWKYLNRTYTSGQKRVSEKRFFFMHENYKARHVSKTVVLKTLEIKQ